MEVLSSFVPPLVERLLSVIEGEATLLKSATYEFRKLLTLLTGIKEVLEYAEGKRIHDPAIRQWLAELRQIAYDVDDLVDDCQLKAVEKTVVRRQGSHGCCASPLTSIERLRFRHKMGVRVAKLNARLEEIHSKRSRLQLIPLPPGGGGSADVPRGTGTYSSRETSSSVVGEDIVGIDEDVHRLMEWLVEDPERKTPTIGAISGMSGIGKTTLAQMLFNHDQIYAHFSVKIWAFVSQEFSQLNLLKDIVHKAGGTYGEALTKDALESKLKAAINNKRLLLVLDDVWSVNVWNDTLRAPLLNTTGSGSKILVTTRNQQIVREMHATYHHKMRFMSDENCWSMLCKIVFEPNTEDEEMEALRDIGMKSIRNCDGLPLAVKLIGGFLKKNAKKKEAWERIAANGHWDIKGLPEDVHNALVNALYVSYMDLPSPLKQCFVFCSLFSEYYPIEVDFIIQAWIAEGFIKATGKSDMEDIAKDYLQELVERGLLEKAIDHDKLYYRSMVCYKMHDFVRSYVCSLEKDEYCSNGQQSAGDIDLKLRHLSMVMKESVILVDIKKRRCLRTLFLHRSQVDRNSLLDDVFIKLVYLRVLDLSGTDVEILPDFITRLVHLRLLNLSSTLIKELPESICRLHNLLSLNVDCKQLSKLPKGVSLLTNLRGLFVSTTTLNYMPQGIGRLTSLRRLDGFVIGPREIPEGHESVCAINELRDLTQLHFLHIQNLERASITTCATNVPSLKEKTRLKTLSLSCRYGYQATEDSIHGIKQLLEQLHPPECLEELIMDGFYGRELPCWMCGSSLRDLTKLDIVQADNIEAIENISSIKKLRIRSMPDLKRISNLCKLESLFIESCSALKEVQDVGKLKHVKLHDYVRDDLPNGIQHISNIQSLDIYGKEGLIKNCYEDGKEWTKIKHIPHIIRKVAVLIPLSDSDETFGVCEDSD